jgi:hypothetical protein
MPDGANTVRTVPAAPHAPVPEPPFSPFSPRSLEAAMQLAEFLCRAKTLPEFLRGNPGDMLMVIEQAARWRMSPFAVAQGAYSVKGKLGFEGKLIHAAIESSPLILGYIDYSFSGTGNDRTVTVSATRRGETKPRSLTIRLGDVRTTSPQWARQPDQQLCYHAVRVWSRRYAPSVLAGVYAPEEFDAPFIDGVAAAVTLPEPPVIEAEPQADTPTPEPSAGATTAATGTLRDAINAEVPLEPRKPTVGAWLDTFAAALAQCSSRDEVEAALLSDETLKAGRMLRGAARQRLRELRNGALARYPEVPRQDDMHAIDIDDAQR